MCQQNRNRNRRRRVINADEVNIFANRVNVRSNRRNNRRSSDFFDDDFFGSDCFWD